MWKAEFKSDKLEYLAKMSKQSVEGTPWFLLAAYNKRQKEIN